MQSYSRARFPCLLTRRALGSDRPPHTGMDALRGDARTPSSCARGTHLTAPPDLWLAGPSRRGLQAYLAWQARSAPAAATGATVGATPVAYAVTRSMAR
jgi:hypothetical protein